jgi:hypothetical protein
MRVYPELLVFTGAGLVRWQLQRHEIARGKIQEIISSTSGGVPGFFRAFGAYQYRLRVISKPGGAFGDHDEYFFQFDTPSVGDVINTLRDAGCPVK